MKDENSDRIKLEKLFRLQKSSILQKEQNWKHQTVIMVIWSLTLVTRVEPRFNEIPKHWGNWFVILSVRYIEILDLTNLQFIGSLWLAGHSKCTQWNTWGGFQRFHSLNDRNFQHLKIFFPLVTKVFVYICPLVFFSVYRCQTLYSTSILELNRDMYRRVWFLGLDWIFTSTAILDHTNHLVATITIKKRTLF